MTQDEGFHPIGRACEELPFSRETIYQLNVLEDGTAVVLRRIRGDLDCARHLVENHPTSLSYSVSGGSEGEGLAYVHVQPPDPIAEVIELPRRHEVVFEFPWRASARTNSA